MSKSTKTPSRKPRDRKSEPVAAPPVETTDGMDAESKARFEAVTEKIKATIGSLEIYNAGALEIALSELQKLLTVAREDQRREEGFNEREYSRFIEAMSDLLSGAEYLERTFAEAAALSAIDWTLKVMRSKECLNIQSDPQGVAAESFVVNIARTQMGLDVRRLIDRLTEYQNEREADGVQEDLGQAINDAVFNNNPADGPALYRQLNAVFRAVKSDKRVDKTGRVIPVHRKR